MSANKNISSSLFNMAFVLTLVCAGSAFMLGFVHKLTEAPVAEARKQKEIQAISEVVYSEFNNNPYEEVHQITTANDDKLSLYPVRLDKHMNSVAIKTFSDNGFGGRIELIVGFFLDGTINKYKIISHKETPGLGTKVAEEKFSSQFEGLNPGKGHFKVRQDGGDIDAVTAATISSRAVIDAIQKAYDAYNKLSTGN